jgi:hypothetical protein
MRAAHGEIRAGLVERDEPAGVYLRRPVAEPFAFGVDARTILFRRSAQGGKAPAVRRSCEISVTALHLPVAPSITNLEAASFRWHGGH